MEHTNFIESSKRERYSLVNILPSLKVNPKFQWYHEFTEADGFDPYDCLLTGTTGDLTKTFLIEVKIREREFPTMVLEKKKLLAMRKLIKDKDNTRLLYINVCPTGTYIFDITTIDFSMKSEILHCNRHTAVYTDKIDKEVYMLPVGMAIRKLPFKFSNDKYHLWLQEQKEKQLLK